jgi:putative transposase
MVDHPVASTSPQEKLKPSLVYAKTRYENGLMKDCSHQFAHPEGNVYTIFPSIFKPKELDQLKNVPRKRKGYATAECPLKDKRTILNDRFNICSPSTLITELSRILALESTSNVKVSVPFWSSQAKEWSPRLWLPIETDCAASHSNWSNGSFTSMESNSWFSIKKWTPQDKQSLQRTSLPSSTFSIAESMGNENTKTKSPRKKKKPTKKLPANCSTKVRLSPPPEVATCLKKWFGSVRYTYNWALGCIKKKPTEYRKTDPYWLRKRFVNECNIPKDKQFLLDTPKHVRDTAITDLALAFKTNFAKDSFFDIQFRRKKDGNQSITIPYDAIKEWDAQVGDLKMYPTYLKNKIAFHTRKNSRVPKTIGYDCKLLLDKLGRFYLSIAYHEPVCESQAGKEEWCSIDPGVRTFMTIYSPTPGQCYKLGDKDISRVYRLCKHMDNLTSKRDKETRRRNRKAMNKALIRIRNRIRNLVDEVHKKVVSFLLSRFQNIIIPPFEVKNMTRRIDRKINSPTVRKMICWSHYRFRQRLLFKSKLLAGVSVHIMGEEYTSKTCTHCQYVKKDLGGSKTFRCSCCGLIADRDVCGARNILMKNLAPFESASCS